MPKARQNSKALKKVLFALSVCIVVLLCILFVAVQAASAGNRLQDSLSFGIGTNRFSVDAQVGVIANGEFENSEDFDSENTSLATYSTRDISTAISAISFRIESAAKAAAEAAKAEEMVKANIAKNRRNEHARAFGMPSGLSEVNWDVGRLNFVAEWTIRINQYFIGTPLANTGEYFANAAWENGIDPRWSPAISNTESGKGFHCFRSHNAWGWGDSGWGSWEDAIYSHVGGLSSSYGYTIARSYAEKYCPPNSDNWYANTLSEMCKI